MENYVWYACYGSNINEDRFNYYIKGGKYPVNGSVYSGCRNKDNFIEKANTTIKYGLYFAEKSDSWDKKAVAFITSKPNMVKYLLDKMTKRYSSTTKCTLYKVTEEQFIDILAQENGQTPSLISPIISLENLRSISPREQLLVGESNENRWYGRILRLGNYKDRFPVYTFTSKTSDSNIKEKEPSAKYLSVIGEGILGNSELNRKDLVRYIFNLKGVHRSSWTKEKLVHLFKPRFKVVATNKRNPPKGQFVAQLNEKALLKNGLKERVSEVIISYNIKNTEHKFKTFVIIQKYPLQKDRNNKEVITIDDETVALDQTIRDAIGCDTLNENLDKEDYTVTLLSPDLNFFNSLKKRISDLKEKLAYDKQLNIVRVFKATPNDMEINICRLGVSTMQSIGIEDGDKIKVKSTTNTILVRALTMSQNDKDNRENPLYIKYEGSYENLNALRAQKEKRRLKRQEKEGDKKLEIEDELNLKAESLAMIFLDFDARQELGIELGDPVIICRSNWYAIQKNIQVITIPLLLALFGIGTQLEVWIEDRVVSWWTISFYIICSILLILVNLAPIRKKFK